MTAYFRAALLGGSPLAVNDSISGGGEAPRASDGEKRIRIKALKFLDDWLRKQVKTGG